MPVLRNALLTIVVLAATGRAPGEDLRLDYTRESLTATYRHYTQYLDGLPVVGGEVIERIDRDGHQQETHRSLAHLAADDAGRRSPRSLAMQTVPAGTLLDEKQVILNENGIGRRASRLVIEETPHHPWAHYVDAVTGALLRSEPLFATARGKVFDVNPVAKLNRPDLRDQNDSAAAVPDAAYSIVELLDLPASGMLIGPNVQIVDDQDPHPPHADAGQSLLFDRSQPQFEEVNAYFQIDRTQRYLQSLGYTGSRRIAGYSVPVDPHAVSGTDNSFYSSGLTPGQGSLYFGDGGVDDAEDADIILHEFAHVMQDSIAPGAFFGSPASEARALGEGIGDYWSFSSNYISTIASGRDPYCIADWDPRCDGDDISQNCGYPAGSDCLRRVDGTRTMADFSSRTESGNEHLNGTIWSSALREIFDGLAGQYGVAEGKRRTDTLVVESMFGAPQSPTYALLARKILDVNRVLNAGADAGLICTAMTRRGILSAGDCDLAPRGDVTVFQSPGQGLAIPDDAASGLVSSISVRDARSIERISVDVDLEHPNQGDLEIFVTAPDGTRVTLASPSGNRAPFSRRLYGLTSVGVDSLDSLRGHGAAGVWTLTIRDLRSGNAGSLRSWSLQITFVGERSLTARPSSFSARRHVAVVGHADGANNMTFVSGLRIFNRGSGDAHITLVFTPSGENGLTRFAAVNAVIRPSEIVAFDDVVSAIFQSRGTGQLEILGDVERLIVTSRASLTGATGTTSEAVPVSRTDEAIGTGALVVLDQLENDAAFRTNIGAAETAGQSGVVQFTIRDASGAALGVVQQTILPLGHLQIPMTFSGALLRADVTVISGNARVLAYASVIDQSSGDGMFVPAQRQATADEIRVLPAIRAPGESGTLWQTALTLTNSSLSAVSVMLTAADSVAGQFLAAGQSLRDDDVLANPLGRLQSLEPLFVSVRAGTTASARIFTPCQPSGSCGEFVPVVSIASNGPQSPVDLIGLEESPRMRSNIGLINASDAPALVRLTAFDAAGTSLGSSVWTVTGRSLRQIPLRALIAGPLTNGRVRAEILSVNDRRLVVYGSIVDKVTHDPSYISGDE